MLEHFHYSPHKHLCILSFFCFFPPKMLPLKKIPFNLQTIFKLIPVFQHDQLHFLFLLIRFTQPTCSFSTTSRQIIRSFITYPTSLPFQLSFFYLHNVSQLQANAKESLSKHTAHHKEQPYFSCKEHHQSSLYNNDYHQNQISEKFSFKWVEVSQTLYHPYSSQSAY